MSSPNDPASTTIPISVESLRPEAREAATANLRPANFRMLLICLLSAAIGLVAGIVPARSVYTEQRPACGDSMMNMCANRGGSLKIAQSNLRSHGDAAHSDPRSS
jgi:hypothetical protein